MIPVVAHVYGVDATRFASDVRIANPSTQRVTATLIFTRSGHDGRTDFGAIDAVLEPGQTIAFDDVVDSAFRTAGSGTLEVLGDVVAMSRTYAETAAGTVGQQVPPGLDVTSRDGAALLVAPYIDTTAGATGSRPVEADAREVRGAESASLQRYNLGVAETSGAGGIVRVGTREIEIAPFSHVQFPIEPERTEIRVIRGDAEVSAYISQVDGATGDAMLIAAEVDPAATRTLIAPVIGTDRWQSDLWLATPDHISAFPNIATTLGFAFGTMQLTLPPGTIGATRIRNGRVSQFVPLLDPVGADEQHLLFIESGGAYRTNIGIVADGPALAQVTVYDAAGHELATQTISTQMAVTVPVTAGRAVVRFLAGHGRAYASLIDNRTGDATLIVYPSARNVRRIATAGAA